VLEKKDQKLKSDNLVINLILLSLMLDFGLGEFKSLLNFQDLPSIYLSNTDKESVQTLFTKQLQVEVSNWLRYLDEHNTTDSVTRIHVEELL